MARSGIVGILLGTFLTLSSPFARADGDDAANRELAMRSLRALGADVDGSSGRCAHCHSLSLFTLGRWGENARSAYWSCFDDERNPNKPAAEKIACMRTNPADPNSGYDPHKIGYYAAGSHLPFFAGMFQAAYPADQWQAQYNRFRSQVQMPAQGDDFLGQADFDAIISWAKKGEPFLEQILGRPGDPPVRCVDEIKPELKAHITSMATQGWEAKNSERGLMMFGCASGQSKLACMDQKKTDGKDVFTEASQTTFGRDWARDFPQQKLRVLREIPFRTSYWMRSSADGRFFANGRYDSQNPDAEGGAISDLENQLLDGAGYRDIAVRASYDPGFFPDNSGFMFQGTSVGAGFCSMSLIENRATTKVLFEEPECSGSRSIGLYQAIGASLDGSDYLAIAGSFESDGGFSGATQDNVPSWFEQSYLDFVPIINDGQHFRTMDPVQKWTPFLGDWGLSPSNLLTTSRVSGVDENRNPKQMGYKFHLVQKTRTDQGYAFDLKEVGTVCLAGNKGNFSFDERFFVTYHYTAATDWKELGYPSADDQGFKDLMASGSGNLYVVDLLTGAPKRITHMGAGQYALFPHFRSDGWLYFLVYDRNQGKRFIAATDAVIRMSGLTH